MPSILTIIACICIAVAHDQFVLARAKQRTAAANISRRLRAR